MFCSGTFREVSAFIFQAGPQRLRKARVKSGRSSGSPPEGHSASGRQEVQFVFPYFFIELFRRHHPVGAVDRQRLWVEAVLAAQRAGHEPHEGGHSFAVHRYPQP